MNELRRCTKCVTPETHETIVYNQEGVCNVCSQNEYKQSDKWTVPSGAQPGTDLTAELLSHYQDQIVNTYVEHLAPFVKVFVRNNISTEVEDRY